MKIASIAPNPPPPREITMSFPQGEGWAIVAALREYADRNPRAVNESHWREWAKALDRELRR